MWGAGETAALSWAGPGQGGALGSYGSHDLLLRLRKPREQLQHGKAQPLGEGPGGEPGRQGVGGETAEPEAGDQLPPRPAGPGPWLSGASVLGLAPSRRFCVVQASLASAFPPVSRGEGSRQSSPRGVLGAQRNDSRGEATGRGSEGSGGRAGGEAEERAEVSAGPGLWTRLLWRPPGGGLRAAGVWGHLPLRHCPPPHVLPAHWMVHLSLSRAWPSRRTLALMYLRSLLTLGRRAKGETMP